MTAKSGKENWLKILEAAREMERPVEGPHPVDNDALLNRWSMGLLGEEEHQAIIDHLAHCAECRQIVISMIQIGTLVLPEVTETASEQEKISTQLHKNPKTGTRLLLQALVSVAALVFFGLMLFQWSNTSLSIDDQIGFLETQLQQGKIRTVYEKSRSLLAEPIDDAQRAELQKLLKQSGSELAEKALADEKFGSVLKIEEQLAQAGIASSELANLKMQAKRGFSQPVLLAQLDRLDRDFDYDLQGYSITKSLNQPSPEDPTAQRIQAEYIAELQQYPQSIDLKLNYGQFLLRHLQLEEALQQFDDVLSQNSHNVLALMGRGLTCFQMRRYDEAASSFQAALKQEPDLLSAKIDLAITYQKQEQTAKAKTLWQEILKSTTDDRLKQRIEELFKQ